MFEAQNNTTPLPNPFSLPRGTSCPSYENLIPIYTPFLPIHG